jgi:hypothetical protein
MQGKYQDASALYATLEDLFHSVQEQEIQEEVATAEINHAQLLLTDGKLREATSLLFDASQRCKRYDTPSMQRLARMARKRLDALLIGSE